MNKKKIEMIKALYESDLLDKTNYEIALEKGLSNCKFNEIKQTAYQYALLDLDRKINSKEELNNASKLLSEYFEKEVISFEDDFYSDEMYASYDYLKIEFEPVKAYHHKANDSWDSCSDALENNEMCTLVLFKVNYIFNPKLNDYECREALNECRDMEMCLNVINQFKNGLKLFLDHKEEYEGAEWPDSMDFGLCNAFYVNVGGINDDEVLEELEYEEEYYIDEYSLKKVNNLL